MTVRYGGEMRHLGNLVLLFVAAAWIHRIRAPRRNRIPSTALLVIIGAFQLQSFVAATRGDWKYTFSGGRDLAARIEKADLQNLPIVAGPDAFVLTVTSYLDRTFISSQSEEVNVTQVFHSRRRGFSTDELIARAAREVRSRHRPVLVISTGPLQAPVGLKFKLLWDVPGAAVDESFWAYRMDE